jgi:hypothetical protein
MRLVIQDVEQLSTRTGLESVSNLILDLVLLVAADVDIITMHIVRYRLVLRPCLGGPGNDRDRQLLLRTSRRMRLVLVFSFPIEFSTCSSPLLAHDLKYPQYSYAFSRTALRCDFGTYDTFRVMGS